MGMYDLIEKKKHGEMLSKEELHDLISGYVSGEIPDYQMAAFLMAVYFRGMTEEEAFHLTVEMLNSGDRLDLSSIEGVKVDKHSTGGVGDKTTITLGPLVAALGVPVCKLSGKGLGHTGGTIDKFSAFPGFSTSLPEDQFMNQVRSIGISIAGQTANLAPADKKIYALRDTTACVDQVALIASSIMSKKLASGSDAIVLDVKVGNGAFMQDLASATELARLMVSIGEKYNKKTEAFLTNMDQPLGYAVGNTLEVIEAIHALKGEGPKDYMDLIYALADGMLRLGGKSSSKEESYEMIQDALSSGKAFHKFKELLIAQGSDASYADDPESLLKIREKVPVLSEEDGYVSRILAKNVGHASMLLGGGRATMEDTIDLSVGIMLHKKVGDSVKKGDLLAELYVNDSTNLKTALSLVQNAYEYSKEKVSVPEVILGHF